MVLLFSRALLYFLGLGLIYYIKVFRILKIVNIRDKNKNANNDREKKMINCLR